MQFFYCTDKVVAVVSRLFLILVFICLLVACGGQSTRNSYFDGTSEFGGPPNGSDSGSGISSGVSDVTTGSPDPAGGNFPGSNSPPQLIVPDLVEMSSRGSQEKSACKQSMLTTMR